MKTIVGIALIFLLASTPKCSPSKIERNIANLNADRNTAFESLRGIQLQLSDAQLSLANMEMRYKSGVFNAGSEGFQRVDSEIGTFIVSLMGVVPYANGYKATFNIGNPLAAGFAGVKLQISWGKPLSSDENWEEWRASLKSKTVNLASLEPGRWNKSVVTLSPAKPEEVGYISVEIETPSILLIKP